MMKLQEVQAAEIKQAFQTCCPLVVHWNGELMQDLESKDQIDRLPVLVTGDGSSKLLVIAKLSNYTGEAQAATVYDALVDWDLSHHVKALCFDTTSSNTARCAGACPLLERKAIQCFILHVVII